MNTGSELARRIEGIEADALRAFAENVRRLHPGAGAVWESLAGGVVAFTGDGSLMNEAKAFGMDNATGEAEIAWLESFFSVRGFPARCAITPYSAAGLLGKLVDRGFAPGEFESMLYQPINGDPIPAPERMDERITIRRATAADRAGWCDILVRCFFPGGHDLTPGMTDFADSSFDAEGLTPYLVLWDGQPAGAGTMSVFGRTALLAGSGTLPEFRGRGLHAAFIARRLADAAARGCDLAVYSAQPGSVSQANAEKLGFRLAYSRLNMTLQPPVA